MKNSVMYRCFTIFRLLRHHVERFLATTFLVVASGAKRSNVLQIVCVSVALVCIMYGVLKGEAGIVRANAENTCYSCIGLE